MLPRVVMRTVLCLGSKVAYNLTTLRKPAGIVLSLLFLAAWTVPFSGQQHPGPARMSRLLLIIPFENIVRMSLKLQPTPDAYLLIARLDLAEDKSAFAAQNLDHALVLDPANAAAAALKRDIRSGAAGEATSQFF
jgi:hypothetical protein